MPKESQDLESGGEPIVWDRQTIAALYELISLGSPQTRERLANLIEDKLGSGPPVVIPVP
jgi:hypothetical protein